VKDEKGRTDYIRDDQGNVVKSHLNEGLLQQIAGATDGGFYLPLRGAKTIDTLYERGLAPLPKTEGQEKLIKHYHERYHWPLAAAILLLLVEMLLPERKRERKINREGRPNPNAQRRSPPLRSGAAQGLRETAGVVSAIVLIALPLLTSASPSTALREYQSGKYDEALKEYQRELQKKSDDPRLNFNAGAAAYREHKLDEALKHFGSALTARDLKLQEQAYYNLGNTLYRTGEALPDPQKRIESWENAVKQYESAIKLNTNNADAKFNRSFVEKQLEELKKQQQQQQKQNQNKDQKDQQQDKKNDQQQTDQQQKQEENKDQQAKQQQAKNDQQKKEDQQSQNEAKKQEQEKKEDQQQAKSSGDKSKEKPEENQEEKQAQQIAAHAMTPQEARQLLDAQKGDEQILQFAPQGEPRSQERALKDW
jgi:Ca-activated chloride channel family protein